MKHLLLFSHRSYKDPLIKENIFISLCVPDTQLFLFHMHLTLKHDLRKGPILMALSLKSNLPLCFKRFYNTFGKFRPM